MSGGQKRRISAPQLMTLFLLARIMHAMIFRESGFRSGTPMMLALICSTAVEAVLAIPAVMYFSCGGSDPAAELFGRRAVWLRAAYSLYFTVICGATVALFTGFLESEFPDITRPLTAMALILLAAYISAGGGIEGLARAGTIVFWLFAVLFIAMAWVNEGGFDWLNVTPMTKGDLPDFVRYFAEDISSSWWLPMFCVLGTYLRNGGARAAYGYLALKLLTVGTLILLVTLVLWRYVDVLGYPIFALGAYARNDFIQRFDAINMFVWTVNCVAAAGVYIFISARALPEKTSGRAVMALAAGVCALIVYRSGLEFDNAGFLVFKAAGVLLLGTVVPLAALIVKKRSERCKGI